MKRLSPSLILSIGALVLAASGGAFALGSRQGSITACVHRHGGALYVARRCAGHDRSLTWNARGPAGAPGAKGDTGAVGPAGSQGQAGQQGIQGVAGTPATKLFAVVDATGTIVSSSPGVQSHHFATGVVQFNFGQDITHCAALATIGAVPIFSTPGASTGRTPGYALADLESGGSTQPGSGYPSGDAVEVETFAGSSDALADTAFSLAVFC